MRIVASSLAPAAAFPHQLLSVGSSSSRIREQHLQQRNYPGKSSSFSKREPKKEGSARCSTTTAPPLVVLKAALKDPTKTTTTRSTKKKRIQWAQDANGQVATQLCPYPKASSKYHGDLYWSDREKGAIQFLAKSHAETFLMDNEEVVEALDKAFLSCCNDEQHEDKNSPQVNRANLKTICQWAMSNVRGLEDAVSCEFHEERSLANAMILDYHVYLNEELEEEVNNSEEASDELLRAFSEKVSARSREFAAKMGAGDAFAAKRAYQKASPVSTAA